ncbi:hypothetical protein [Ancylobacter terrae]|uniref:hypothetical protein n=1 Tax=Ancylobacter sp. sgz301288 TaxID=3342077 RepID=UPI00385912ED
MRSTEETLATALARGLITPEQRDGLRAIAAEPAAALDAVAFPPPPQDDEKLRFITGFGDIFVTIGLGLFLSSLAYFASGLELVGMTAVLALASWLLAEFFTRRQRMALPSIVLLVVYALTVFLGLSAAVAQTNDFFLLREGDHPLAMALAGLLTFAAVGLHYWRFRVPITLAAGAAALVASVLALATALSPDTLALALDPLLVGCGLAVFALAMWFDLSDPLRQTRRTDIAFWLHLLAAPLIVHPLLGRFVAEARIEGGEIAAWPILAVFAALGVVAVLVDRRALLVSGLVYAGIAFGSLMSGAGVAGSVPLTVLALGAFVLLLSAAWHPLRRAILSLLPRALAARLPNPSIAAPS